MDEQANRQMHEEMDRLTHGRAEASRRGGHLVAGSACGRGRLRQSGGDGLGRTGAVWEAPGAALPDHLTHPSLGLPPHRPQGASRTASGRARRKCGSAHAPL